MSPLPYSFLFPSFHIYEIAQIWLIGQTRDRQDSPNPCVSERVCVWLLFSTRPKRLHSFFFFIELFSFAASLHARTGQFLIEADVCSVCVCVSIKYVTDVANAPEEGANCGETLYVIEWSRSRTLGLYSTINQQFGRVDTIFLIELFHGRQFWKKNKNKNKKRKLPVSSLRLCLPSSLQQMKI